MYFDVVLIGDLRVPGGTSRQIANEIRALHGAGYRVGLVNVEMPHARGGKPIDPAIRARLAAGEAIRVGDEPIDAGLAIFENPRTFMELPARALRITAKRAIVALHFSLIDGMGVTTFDPERVLSVCRSIVEAPISFAATSRLTWNIFREHRPDLELLEQILCCIVLASEFRVRRSGPLKAIPVIGRHSRPQPDKWPPTRGQIFEVYPARRNIEVALLGVDDALLKLIGRIPDNWRTYAFDEVTPAAFLATIDFFVYFHHPRWVEAFGIAAAEAMASGAVAVLPKYMRANFGDAALYCEPDQVVRTVLGVHRDKKKFRKQSDKGRTFVLRHHSPRSYLDAVTALIPKRPVQSRTIRYDIIVAGDLRRTGGQTLHIANAVRAQAEAGYRTALMHVPAEGRGGRVRPEILNCIRNGYADVLEAGAGVRGSLLLLHGAGVVLDDSLGGVKSDRVIVVVSNRFERNSWALGDRLLRAQFGAAASWVPSNDSVRIRLEEDATLRIEPENWPIVADIAGFRERRRGQVPVVGVACDGERDSEALKRVSARFPADGSIEVQFFGAPADQVLQKLHSLKGWRTFKSFEMSLAKMLDQVDVLYCPGPIDDTMEFAAAEAMRRGLPIVAAPELRRVLGEAPIYCAPSDTTTMIEKLFSGRQLRLKASLRGKARARRLHSADAYCACLSAILGRPVKRPAIKVGPRRRVLMFAQNGVGLGHVVRELAISAELSRTSDIVFCSMSQAFDIVARCGYQVEYLPSHVYTGAEYTDWHAWTRAQLDQMIDFYDVGAVVLDGSVPYRGLIEAVAPRPDVRLVWVRRPMWRPGTESSGRRAQQRFYDLIIAGLGNHRTTIGVTNQYHWAIIWIRILVILV